MAIKYNRIGEVLKSRGISQTWLAKQLKINATVVNRYCTNSIQPSLKRLFEIAEVLQVDPGVLLGDGKDNDDK